MTHYEVGFKLQHDCPMNDFSRKYPSVVMAWWCNFDKDVLEVSSGDLGGSKEFKSDLDKMILGIGGRQTRRTTTGTKVQVVLRCDCMKAEYSTTRVFEKNNCLELQPSVLAEGWEWYRVIAFSENDLKALFIDLDKRCYVEIVSNKAVEQGSVRDTFVISTPSLLGGLTGNQADALQRALDSGYYLVPKKATTKEIAKQLGLPRTTFEERLRKAESKVLQSVGPYMQLSTQRRRKGRAALVRVRAGSKVEPGTQHAEFALASPRIQRE